ncbi:MAG: hypothetical protein J5698_02560 [Bacteroidaceae bacterium]|nr:hypothetical protein [Bacteroidaceae bacterium]
MNIENDAIIASEETDLARVVFASAEGGYTMKDASDRFIYLTGTFNSYNVAKSINEGHIWTVTANGDGTFSIVNVLKNKTVWLSKNYNSWGCYPSKTEDYLYPNLYKYIEGDEGDEGNLETSKISDLVAKNQAIKAQVEGTVVASYSKGFLVSDGTGRILVFLNATPDYAVGDQVTVKGSLTSYAGMLQFPSESEITKTGTTTVSEPAIEFTERDMDDLLGTKVVQYGQYTGTLAISGNYYNVTVPDCQTAVGSISYPNSGLIDASWDGCEVTVKGYFIGTSSEKYFNTMATSVTCENPYNPNFVDPVGSGTKADPYNVSKFHEVSTSDNTKGWVKGIVVGYLAGTINSPKFGINEGDSVYASNILIADKADCDNVTYCVPVQVSKDTKFYKAVNLAGNPQVLGKEIAIEGEFQKYFGVQGIKNVSAFIIDGTETKEKEEADEVNVAGLIAKSNDKNPHYVTGYIVGYISGKSFADRHFNDYSLATDSVVTNIILSDDPQVTDSASIIPVQLPVGDVRAALNLFDNTTNWHAKVRLLGTSDAYFGVPGLKNVTEYQILEPGTTLVKDIVAEEQKPIYFDLTGKQVAVPKSGLYIKQTGSKVTKVLIR